MQLPTPSLRMNAAGLADLQEITGGDLVLAELDAVLHGKSRFRLFG